MAPNLFLHLTNTLEPCFEQGFVLPAEDAAAPMTEAANCIQKVCILIVVENVKKCRPWKWKSLSCVHGILQARILEWVAFPFSRGSSKPRSPALQVDSLPAEPQGEPVQAIAGYLILAVASPMSGKRLERVKNNFS